MVYRATGGGELPGSVGDVWRGDPAGTRALIAAIDRDHTAEECSLLTGSAWQQTSNSASPAWSDETAEVPRSDGQDSDRKEVETSRAI